MGLRLVREGCRGWCTFGSRRPWGAPLYQRLKYYNTPKTPKHLFTLEILKIAASLTRRWAVGPANFVLFDVLFESSVLFNVLFDMLCFVRCFVRHNVFVFCSMFGERSNSEQFVRVHVRWTFCCVRRPVLLNSCSMFGKRCSKPVQLFIVFEIMV